MKKARFITLLLILLILPTACGRQRNTTDINDTAYTEPVIETDAVAICNNADAATYPVQDVYVCIEPQSIQCPPATRYENLAKLARVWGFTKYTHHSFISGALCWDEELLRLIPIIYDAYSNDVNDILYEWFVGLGEDGYDLEHGHDFVWQTYRTSWLTALSIENAHARQLYARGQINMDWYTSWQAQLDDVYNFIASIGVYEPNWQGFVGLWNDAFPYTRMAISPVNQELRAVADFYWINSSYLGAPLAARLARFNGITAVDRQNAPVIFDGIGNSDFSNQRDSSGADLREKGNRLLGLFRMWNAMLYFYPNMDIIDYCWYYSLVEYIPIMLQGTQRQDFLETIVSLARRLDDAHVTISGRATHTRGRDYSRDITASHMLLENNIGLINPSERFFRGGDTHSIMQAFADTDGLIIDLRQYPCFSIVYDLAQYIVAESTVFVQMSRPMQHMPGSFVYSPAGGISSGGISDPQAFFYDRPVVLLMNRSTMSRGEFAVMSLRNGENVTVIGSNSIGANGDITSLPLPGRYEMIFTGLGVFTPDGGQTHRIGLSPDIYYPTEDRRALMEAAIACILGGG